MAGFTLGNSMPINQQVDRQESGFTLVELLVVISIVALLIAILLPVISRARQTAQNLNCAANLHTLGQLLVLHISDHRGYLPLAGNIVPGTDLNGLDDPQSLGDGLQQNYDYYENTPGQFRVTALPAALAPYIAKQSVRDDSWQDVEADIGTGPVQAAFLCPSDQNTIDRTYDARQWIHNYAGGGGNETYLTGWSSYGFNSEVFGWTDAGVNGTTDHSRARGKISSIPRPSETMLMCDTNAALEIWVLAPQLSLGDVYLGTGGTVGSDVFDLNRHHGRLNILFVDGHVDSPTILSTGATSSSTPLGSPGNSPSGALMGVSMDKDFR
jgi:prepilin-type N-terminal cleavage/methylation domain-containing protein/prepilin-type processing-associated H-X9-DG protein